MDTLFHSLARTVQEEGWHPLNLALPAAARASALDHAHGDSFDRMLAAQAQLAGLALVTTDAIFAELNLAVLWSLVGFFPAHQHLADSPFPPLPHRIPTPAPESKFLSDRPGLPHRAAD